MDINSTTGPVLPERGNSSTTSINSDSCSSTAFCQGRPAKKMLPDRLHLHQLTRKDYKDRDRKEQFFNKFTKALMPITGWSQTTLLDNTLSAIKLIPYLRKITPEKMAKISDNPADLQTTLLLELTVLIKQGYKLQELCRLATESSLTTIEVNKSNQTISINENHFTRDDLGGDTFRELYDRLTASGKKKQKDPRVILADTQKRKAVSIDHWQDVLSMVLDSQDPATRQHIASALNTLRPATETQCNTLISLIPTLTLKVHPGFLMMNTLSSWLAQHHLNGGKLSSKQLTWINSMDMHFLYTFIPRDLEERVKQEEKLYIYLEPLVSTGKAATPREQLAKKTIDDTPVPQLTKVVELFDALLCDLTPSVDATNRLGIIYTLLKFTDRPLLESLLTTSSIGSDLFFRMYLTQLVLTYPIIKLDHKEVKCNELRMNCLIKTLQLRMARCIIMMATKDELSVPPSVLDRARTLIDHHNEGLRAVLSDAQLGLSNDDDYYMDFDDFDDGYQGNATSSSSAKIPQSDYLSIPDHLLPQAVTLDPQKLILPQDKHFRTPALKRAIRGEDRRIEQTVRWKKKQWEDCLLMSRSTDLTRAVDWAKIDIPITFLFSGSDYEKSRLPFVLPVFNNELLPIIQQAVSEATQQQTMDVISELLALSQSTGKPGLDIRAIITSIQGQTSNPTLRHLLQQLAIKLPELHSNTDRKLLLEFCAFQLFSEIQPSSSQFKRLVKMLYVIQSRSKQFHFGETEWINYERPHNPKIPMGDFFRKGWNQPDGLLGSRIRQSIKDTFKQCDKTPSYQQVMDSLVESMRPWHQPSKSYPELIQKLSLDIEKTMNQRRELEHLKKHFMILESHYKPHYPSHLDYHGKELIEMAAQLCKQFPQEEQDCSTATASSDMVSADSDLTLSDQIGSTLPPDSYLHDQTKALISSIGCWLEQIHEDSLISEEDANAAGLGELAEFVKSTVIPNHSPQNEVKIVGQIIALRDKFHYLQNAHSQWKSSVEITSTQSQLVETRNTLNHLKDVDLLAPDKLQKEINKIISGPEIQELSPEDKELLSTVSELRNRYAKTELVRKALSHPQINEFNRSPELLSHRIAEINSVWSESVRSQHNQFQSLKCMLNKLQSKPLVRDFEKAQQEALDRTRKWHELTMANLQSTQQRCESHLVQQLSFQDGQPLLSILESMEQSHTAKHSGIEANPLSAPQRSQLKAAIESAPADCSLSDGNSLFDWIGMKETRQQPIAAATNSGAHKSLEKLETVKTQVFKDLAYFARKNTDRISEEQKKIDSVNKTLTEMNAAHYNRVKELKVSKEELSNLLNNQMLAEIIINGKAYSYTDALVGFIEKDRYHSDDLTIVQQSAKTALREARRDGYNKSESYQRDQQWLQIARACRSRNINPATLSKVIELIELEELEHFDDIENKIATLQQRIQSVEQTIADNSARVQAEVAKLDASLKPALEAQKQQTTEAQQALFTRAFEHGQQLSEGRAIQRLLCQYLRENRDTASVKANIVTDYEALKKHIPNAAEIIEPPRQYTGWRNWSSPANLLFHIINVPGAFPLLESLHEKGGVSQRHLLSYDAEGKPSSALIFAAAKGRYKACETLIKCLVKSQTKSADQSDQPDDQPDQPDDQPDQPVNVNVQASQPLDLDCFIQMLTADRDNRNLLHYVAQLAKPEVWKALLQLITIVSNKQDFDADYPIEDLQNRVAEDREHIIKMLLAQTDSEGLRPTDLLLFNVAKRIREWPEDNEQALTSFCNDFLLNDAKTMWKTASSSLSVEQLHHSMACFMKGIDDLDRLSPKKRQAAETFLDKLMRIFRVHGPAGQHEQMIKQLTSSIDALNIFDSPPTKRARKS